VIEDIPIASFKLEQYKYIMTQLWHVNVSLDKDYQTKFNGFYGVRRNAEWRHHFYDLFERCKKEDLTFSDIITNLYEKTGNIEPSFSSKMYATVHADRAIWDQHVLKNLGFKLTGQGKERLQNAIALYAKIERWYVEFLKTQNAKDCIAVFDEVIPSYQWISDTKKIDFFLWGTR